MSTRATQVTLTGLSEFAPMIAISPAVSASACWAPNTKKTASAAEACIQTDFIIKSLLAVAVENPLVLCVFFIFLRFTSFMFYVWF